MAALDSTLRGNFEKEVIKARDEAENAAQATMATLAVERDRPFDSMSEEKRALRRALRVRARQLGEGDMTAGMPRLIEEIAYEQWHRMLFARFLAENDLLMHPEGVAVTLEECAELAQEEGAEDLWAVATRYASLMLPGIFRVDDPALQVRFAPEGQHKLEQIVTELPRAVFTSDDGLGWAYQFWQSKKKDEVNASERKIGGADIAPVTQLFTEDYMVKFLLHNTLGAWWAHRNPDSPLNKTFDYLRYRDDGTPAAGTFDGWPNKVAEVTMMDPCGGSGHFVVAAFEMFYHMRMVEEGLSAAEAGDAVIRKNLHMLELDLRCTQLASFSLALAAWKSGKYRELPIPNIGCAGIPIQGQLDDWIKLAGNDVALEWSLERLHQLFRSAPDLGSLISPRNLPVEERIFIGEIDQLKSLLKTLLSAHKLGETTTLTGFGTSIEDLARVEDLLAGQYVLTVTNVPYLGQNRHNETLKNYLEKHYPDARRDLATAFLERCREYTNYGGTFATVCPQNWLFLKSYRNLRGRMLREKRWELLCWLGSGSFKMISGEVVKPVLLIMSSILPTADHETYGVDASNESSVTLKAAALKSDRLLHVAQNSQLKNPDERVSLYAIDTELPLLSEYADSHRGIGTGDTPRWIRQFWEIAEFSEEWDPLLTTFSPTQRYAGRQQAIFWQSGKGDLFKLAESLKHLNHAVQNYRRGQDAWNRRGIAVCEIGGLHATMYEGEKFANGVAVITPHDPVHIDAIWAFCSSPEFHDSIRKIDQKLMVTSATLLKVPFDLNRWQLVADAMGPLPKPFADDPTQWIFLGWPENSQAPLQVATARLLGFDWREQQKDELSDQSDNDGIVCLPSIVGEPPAAESLHSILAHAYGAEWSLAKQRKLLANISFRGKGLGAWLRDSFFKQHCKLFKNRPFIWHIWDGRKDGFSALVNYHKLDRARFGRLIYTYLGDWINTQRAEQGQGVAGADGRLVAALELKKKLEVILEGEPPYDIYVRWKPLHEQPIGWKPNLNDGVRLNIRPFVKAGVLRNKFTIHWKKDRGKEPDGSVRHNDLHFTRAEKEAARKAALKTR